MRCRKARSFLSAYCNDEVGGRRKLAISEHLATCADCRRLEADYRSLAQVGEQLPVIPISNDFNANLLNRIARERFTETRTKAFLPKRAPVVRWATLIPAVATACLVFAVTMAGLRNGQGHLADDAASLESAILDAYRTVQPVSNPNMTDHMHKDWSLTSQLAQADRIDRMSRRVIDKFRVNDLAQPPGLVRVSARTDAPPAPFKRSYYRVRPVVTVYHSSGSQKGGGAAY